MAETGRNIREIDDFDPAMQRLSQVYAKAFLGAAEKTGRIAELLEEYESLLKEIVIPFQSVERFIAPGTVTHEERMRVLDKALGPHVSTDLMQFLKVVSRHERMDLLEPIGAAARRSFNESRGVVRVEVETAVEMTEEMTTSLGGGLADHIANRMRTILGSEPDLVVRHRPDLIGGVVVRVGDTVFDGSVLYQLEQARTAMLDRSTHEIQSGRDRFSTASGN